MKVSVVLQADEGSTVTTAASTIAAALVEINPGGMRELHWHRNDEWQYYISGRGRMTVFASSEKARTFDYRAERLLSRPVRVPSLTWDFWIGPWRIARGSMTLEEPPQAGSSKC